VRRTKFKKHLSQEILYHGLRSNKFSRGYEMGMTTNRPLGPLIADVHVICSRIQFHKMFSKTSIVFYKRNNDTTPMSYQNFLRDILKCMHI
jgi:hypothetical protein